MKNLKYQSAIALSILIICFLTLAFSGCGSKTDKKAELEMLKKEREKLSEQISKLEKEINNTDKPEQKIKYVTAMKATPQEFNHFLEVQGRIDGEENVAVSPQMAGVVTAVMVKEGDAVRKGQILAQLDDDVMKKSIAELSSALDFANQLYEKQKNLWEKKIGSEVQYLTAKNNKESLVNKLATLNDQLDMMKIKAPINGSVEEVSLKIGQMAAPGMPAFRVINFSKIKVVADVAEAYTSKIRVGNEVIINIPDINKEIKGKISFTSKYINPVNRTFTIEARLDPNGWEPRANMVALIKVNDYKSPAAFIVPVNVIQKSLDKKFVMLAKEVNGKYIAQKQFVNVGLIYNGLTEIKSGINPDDLIINNGFLDLNDGQMISIQQ